MSTAASHSRPYYYQKAIWGELKCRSCLWGIVRDKMAYKYFCTHRIEYKITGDTKIDCIPGYSITTCDCTLHSVPFTALPI